MKIAFAIVLSYAGLSARAIRGPRKNLFYVPTLSYNV